VPPSEAGGVNETDTRPLSGVAVTFVGAPGGTSVALGTIAFDAAEGAPSPASLWATTVNV
jgi:hypothetical protein